MIAGFVAHLWQSTLCAGVAWLLALALRRHQAQARYWVWFLASAKFLIWLLFAGRARGVCALARRISGAGDRVGDYRGTRPSSSHDSCRRLGSGGRRQRSELGLRSGGPLLCGSAGLRRSRFAGSFAGSACGGTSQARNGFEHRQAALSPPFQILSANLDSIEPGVFGVFRPALLLPAGIAERLDRPQLEAILAHELCHVRRRDNLTATIHMAVQAIFWFHPLVWWLGARLVDERERACDEEVLRLGNAPQVYAEGILNVCKLYMETPLACMPGVTGSNLKMRIEAIMKNQIRRELGRGSKFLLARRHRGCMLPLQFENDRRPRFGDNPGRPTRLPHCPLSKAASIAQRSE